MNQPLIIRDFKFTRDFRSINWISTLWYNVLRATMAAVMIVVLQLVLPVNQSFSILGAVITILGMPLVYVIFILPLTLLVSMLSFIPFIGIIGLALALMVAIGDPLVCLLKRVLPAAVPVDEPTIFSLTPVFWLLNVDEEYSIAS